MIAGCGVQGEAYQPRTTPASQSVIYIYRPYDLLGSQANPMITCGHESIELEKAGYDEFLADSGPVTCEQYFIREDVVSSGLASSSVRFKLMNPDLGRDQIKECNRQGIKQ
jgi:hypothetical protein